MSEKHPAEVIYDMLTNARDGAAIDIEAFSDAASKLEEASGASAAFVNDILKQIDAVLYANPVDGKIRLVRVGGGS